MWLYQIFSVHIMILCNNLVLNDTLLVFTNNSIFIVIEKKALQAALCTLPCLAGADPIDIVNLDDQIDAEIQQYQIGIHSKHF